MSKIDTHYKRASAWSFVVAVAIAGGLGLWLDWFGPWWAYLILGIFMYLAIMGAWINAVQDDETHRATLEMNERQKREQDPPEGG